MKKIKEYIVDILFLLGFISFLIGFFIVNTALGFIVTGLGVMALSYSIYKGGDEA